MSNTTLHRYRYIIARRLCVPKLRKGNTFAGFNSDGTILESSDSLIKSVVGSIVPSWHVFASNGESFVVSRLKLNNELITSLTWLPKITGITLLFMLRLTYRRGSLSFDNFLAILGPLALTCAN